VAVSVASVAVCSFFFLPPIYSFRVADSRDLVALVVFLVTAVVVGELGARLRRRARESARLARELSASRARIVAIADETRRRIGRDLHDGPQQGLVSLALELRAAQDAVAAARGDVRAVLSRAADRLARLLEELREISHGIHPAVLTQGGLAPALNALARRSSISVELHVGAEGRLPERVEVAALLRRRRVAHQRGQARARVGCPRWSRAARRRVARFRSRRWRRRCRSVARLRARRPEGPCETLGGKISINSSSGAGTSVYVELPLEDGNRRGARAQQHALALMGL
jgi:signal transduction histidine kinase